MPPKDTPVTTNPDPIVEVMARAMVGYIGELSDFEDHREAAQAALQALSEAGYVVVPKEPTEAMIEAERALHGYSGDRTASAYRAMISAVAP